nr:RecName: Full=Transcription factor jumonji domain-containing protein [Populus euphratica]
IEMAEGGNDNIGNESIK